MYDKNATAIITEVQPPSSVLLGSTASGDILSVYCRDSNYIRELVKAEHYNGPAIHTSG